ncbi:glycoside hydrolase family 108 protein [Hufsiella ginkgonis]|uniref:N-acetylmuramidase n=1 Tax=Hufsiella ginkgonis TaxID=2695274 RepID=A0A7K1Y0P9_9SPHI|nr:glycosyl hydrolase 108 family protein [Hufsiella ginkgonis]MXV16820.1 hypothetical protein [Hufsiella ginkgonis]
MADFNKAFQVTIGHEGGYANNPLDTGGETVFGITRRDHPNSSIWHAVDQHKKNHGMPAAVAKINADNFILEGAKAIYYSSYWQINRLNDINDQAIANELFDTGVNQGTGQAARYLQRALNVTNKNQRLYPDLVIDGKIGAYTINALNSHPDKALLYKILNVMQGSRYIEIMEKAPSQEAFAVSWFSRVDLTKK